MFSRQKTKQLGALLLRQYTSGLGEIRLPCLNLCTTQRSFVISPSMAGSVLPYVPSSHGYARPLLLSPRIDRLVILTNLITELAHEGMSLQSSIQGVMMFRVHYAWKLGQILHLSSRYDNVYPRAIYGWFCCLARTA